MLGASFTVSLRFPYKIYGMKDGKNFQTDLSTAVRCISSSLTYFNGRYTCTQRDIWGGKHGAKSKSDRAEIRASNRGQSADRNRHKYSSAGTTSKPFPAKTVDIRGMSHTIRTYFFASFSYAIE